MSTSLVFHPDAFAVLCDERGRWLMRFGDRPYQLLHPELAVEDQYASILWHSRTVIWEDLPEVRKLRDVMGSDA